MLEFDNGEYESVCIFAEKTDDRDGWICLEGPGGKEQQVHMNDDWYRLVQLALPEKGIYRISRKGRFVCAVLVCIIFMRARPPGFLPLDFPIL